MVQFRFSFSIIIYTYCKRKIIAKLIALASKDGKQFRIIELFW